MTTAKMKKSFLIFFFSLFTSPFLSFNFEEEDFFIQSDKISASSSDEWFGWNVGRFKDFLDCEETSQETPMCEEERERESERERERAKERERVGEDIFGVQ